MHIKTTLSHHLTPVKVAFINNMQAIITGEDVEEREPTYPAGGNINWYTIMENRNIVHLKLNIELLYDPASLLLCIQLEKTIIQKKKKCTPMFIAVVFIIANTWKQVKSPSREV